MLATASVTGLLNKKDDQIYFLNSKLPVGPMRTNQRLITQRLKFKTQLIFIISTTRYIRQAKLSCKYLVVVAASW